VLHNNIMFRNITCYCVRLVLVLFTLLKVKCYVLLVPRNKAVTQAIRHYSETFVIRTHWDKKFSGMLVLVNDKDIC